jgi:hypothetical protein
MPWRWLEGAMFDGVGPLLEPLSVAVESAAGLDWSCKG